jgi:DNA-binding MarR family transcriptional regulator
VNADPFVTLPPDGRPRDAPAKGKAKGAATGRWALFNAFSDGIARDLTPAAAMTWLILFRDTKRNGLARTSQSDIARRAGVTDRAVRDALRELIRRGLVVRVQRGGPGRASVYRVTVRPTEKRKPTSG